MNHGTNEGRKGGGARSPVAVRLSWSPELSLTVETQAGPEDHPFEGPAALRRWLLDTEPGDRVLAAFERATGLLVTEHGGMTYGRAGRPTLGASGLPVGPVDVLLMRDIWGEALDSMTGDEMIIAFLRAYGYSDREICQCLHLRPEALLMRIESARRRIVRRVPELRVTLGGRSRPGRGKGV